MSNGRAERMVSTMTRSVVRLVEGIEANWDPFFHEKLYGYRLRLMYAGLSAFEMSYGVKPRLISSDKAMLMGPYSLST